jgi:hypothetical protein
MLEGGEASTLSFCGFVGRWLDNAQEGPARERSMILEIMNVIKNAPLLLDTNLARFSNCLLSSVFFRAVSHDTSSSVDEGWKVR